MKNHLLILMVCTVLPILSAQDQSGSPKTAPADKKITAILPETNPDLIFVEGEDALSTNFNREPILNYSCSGYRTLQLNKTADAPQGSSYFADYVFYAEKDGTYELWYGGTPPGNKNELLPSYASPFKITIDKLYESDIYRENMHVVSNYAPAYYWNYVKDVDLSAGEHRLRIEVPYKRGYDNKYFFYIDNFFLVRKENGKPVLTGKLPPVFPKDLQDRSIDHPFKSIEDYQILLRDNPEDSRYYVEISMVYSLIGDYLSALKNLRKALLLEPDDPDIELLIAKNRIWKGSFDDGLAEYRDLLEIVPEKLDYWAEAGKVAAWIGQYDESISFYKDALKQFPGNLNLLTNLGITYLWNSDDVHAQKIFKKVHALVGDDEKQYKKLASIFLINGYPDKAVETYLEAISRHPEYLELYFLLENAYYHSGQREKIPGLQKEIDDTFVKTPEFEKALQNFNNKQTMRENVLKEYETDLSNDPDNLRLRKSLAEMYFWNGYKKEAIREYLNILTNYTYRNLRQTRKSMSRFFELLDKSYTLMNFLKQVPEYISNSRKALAEAYTAYQNALAKKNKALKSKGDKVTADEKDALTRQVETTGDTLASLITAKEAFVEKYKTILGQYADDKDYLSRLMDEEKSKTEAFKKLTEGSAWQWDRRSTLDELERVKKGGLLLANYDLGVLYQFEGNVKSARENLSPFEDNKNVKGAAFALFQTDLWMGKTKESLLLYDKNKDAIESAADYVPDLVEYVHLLSTEDEDILGFLTDDPAGTIKGILASYTGFNDGLRKVERDVEERIQKIHVFLQGQMVHNFYNLAENTYGLRNELGDFYQNQKEYPEAIAQYRQVLAIEPWDISAKYKLAQVYDRNGNWAKAEGLYKEVYNEDPVYGNVTAFYNRLAREHADHLSFSGTTFSDSSQQSYTGETRYQKGINGTFGFTLDYLVKNTTYTSSPGQYSPTSSLQSLSFTLPVKLGTLTVTPSAGSSLLSNLITSSGRTAYTAEKTPGALLSAFIPYPFAGADLEVSTGPVIFDAGYGYNWLDETFQPGITPVSYQEGNGSVQVDFGFIKKPVIQDTSYSLTGYFRSITDGNALYGLSSQLSNNFSLLEKPELQMGITGSFSWDSASVTAAPTYWTPYNAVTAGGAVDLSGSFNTGEDTSLSDALHLYAGYYSDDLGKGLSLNLSNNVTFTNKDFSGYVKVSGSVKGNFDYWSVTVELGADAGLPELLSL